MIVRYLMHEPDPANKKIISTEYNVEMPRAQAVQFCGLVRSEKASYFEPHPATLLEFTDEELEEINKLGNS